MSEKILLRGVGVKEFEKRIEGLKAKRYLPYDFKLKEYSDDYSWGFSESDKLAVAWEFNSVAFGVVLPQAKMSKAFVFNEEKEQLELVHLVNIYRMNDFDLINEE